MKESENMFFHGRRMPPIHAIAAFRGYSYKQPLQACGVAGLRKSIFSASIMCLYFYSIFFTFSLCHAASKVPQVCHLDNCVSVEVVSKDEDMQRGLMYREGLKKDTGMFFIFSYDDKHRFWMKNMSFDLDIVWISSEGRIVFIAQNIPACRKDPCAVYAPNEAGRYVLEIDHGYTATHEWKVGDYLRLEGIAP
ncbi:MAG: DUF192 domain-containing protein [Candidatus Omnitrophica bacterium]|nr:DUF192 domain-containing protein [Candidatus Omnitrophota bacterium]